VTMAGSWGWWRRRSLRARLTLITSDGLTLALAGAAVLLVNALRLSLIRGLDDSARQGAVEVTALIDQDRLPDPVPVGSGTITIQVLDAQGRITDVSPDADRLVPLLPPAQARAAARTGQGRMLAGPPLGMPSLLRVVAVSANDGQVVLAAVPFAQASDSISTLAKALLIGTPLLFGLLALATWLLDNAVRHAASTVRVSVCAEDGWAVLEVADDGPGIPAEDTERAFGRFSRLDDARSRDGAEDVSGSGLGLAIVRATAEAHGGSVTLGDAGPGLRATVRLPRPARGSVGAD
jgi:Histidine kinase-, DNA gyrase B-, and HSP90-like ATPase